MKNRFVAAKALFSVIAVILFVGQSDAQQRRQGRGSADVFKFLAEKYDKNDDGKLSKEEYDRSAENFEKFDRNKDGLLSAEDWKVAGQPTRGGRHQRSHGGSTAPVAGDIAPDFELTAVKDAEQKIQLSSFAGKKPVALIFGSCT